MMTATTMATTVSAMTTILVVPRPSSEPENSFETDANDDVVVVDDGVGEGDAVLIVSLVVVVVFEGSKDK